MKLEQDSFYAVHVFYGIRNCFMHYKEGGGFVDTMNASEAERFSSEDEAIKFINTDEDAREYISSRPGCYVYISKIEIIANVKTRKRIA